MIFINFFLLGTEVGLMLSFLVREFRFVRLAAVVVIVAKRRARTEVGIYGLTHKCILDKTEAS